MPREIITTFCGLGEGRGARFTPCYNHCYNPQYRVNLYRTCYNTLLQYTIKTGLSICLSER